MIILGISDGHDAGASLVKDGIVLFAINEERLVREKLYQGTPKQSILKILELSKIQPHEIDKVVIAAKLGIVASLGWTNVSKEKKLYQLICKYGGPIPATTTFAKLQNIILKNTRSKEAENFVRSTGIKAEIEYLDHHLCHAASAYYTSGKKESLVITSDGSGDALSSTVYTGKDGELKIVKKIPTYNSIAYFYGYITTIAGFKMFRHEGKITGLAAHGDPKKCYHIFEKMFGYSEKKHIPINTSGLMGEHVIKKLTKELKPYSREDYSAAIQKRTEDVTTKFVEDYTRKTGINDVAVAGGLFANVRVNQKVAELANVDSLFIHPHMGDGGLSLGAALYAYAEYCVNQGKKFMPFKIDNVYFGPSYSNEQIEEAIAKNNLKYEKVQKIERFIAEKIAEKKIIGHFDGRMEYGPRALGNRSILADPTDTTINDWLNKRLKRTEFMPFAPSIMEETAKDYYKNYEKGVYPAQFMTITFDTTKEAQKAKAVVHVDNTTRPQTVNRKQNPKYYKILKEYQDKTTLPLFVNTSFNIHEEPIVCSPSDAITSFKKGTVDILVLGKYIIGN